MIERVFATEDELFEELKRHSPGSWTGEERDGKWIARALTFEERRHNARFDQDAVEISFRTTADLAEDEETMRDEDWIELGKLVAAIARDERGRRH